MARRGEAAAESGATRELEPHEGRGNGQAGDAGNASKTLLAMQLHDGRVTLAGLAQSRRGSHWSLDKVRSVLDGCDGSRLLV